MREWESERVGERGRERARDRRENGYRAVGQPVRSVFLLLTSRVPFSETGLAWSNDARGWPRRYQRRTTPRLHGFRERMEKARSERRRKERRMVNMPRTVPVQILQEGVASFAVEGAVRPTNFEQRADSPPRTGPAIGTGTRHRRQR